MSKEKKNINSGHANKNDSSDVTEEIMNNPELLASLQDENNFRLKALKNYEQLPINVKKRIKAMKKLQLDHIKIEENFFRELGKLELKFAEQYQLIYDKRVELTLGSREPTESECEYEDSADDLVEDVKNVSINSGDAEEKSVDDVKGVPDFWLTVLQNSDLIRENIQEHDVPVLKHLTDIKYVLKTGDENGFVLEFHFSPNEYFSDEKLIKEYFVQINAPTSCPFSYEGPEIIRTKGCDIHWMPGKNMTVKLVKKVQKCKNRSEKRTVTKVVKNDSFFNFFDPPTNSLGDDDEDISSDVENLLESDFEIGQYIRERIVPHAVLYYTGEIMDDDYDLDDDEDEDDSDEDSDDYQRVAK